IAEAEMMSMIRLRQSGRLDAAIACGERAVERFRALGAPRLEATALANLGLTLAQTEDAARARAADDRAHRMFVELDDRWSQGLALGNLAQLDQQARRLDRALRGYEATVALFE